MVSERTCGSVCHVDFFIGAQTFRLSSGKKDFGSLRGIFGTSPGLGKRDGMVSAYGSVA